MRTKFRPHFRYATPAAPAFRRDRRARPARPVFISTVVETVADGLAPARGVLVAVPLSAAFWAGLIYAGWHLL